MPQLRLIPAGAKPACALALQYRVLPGGVSRSCEVSLCLLPGHELVVARM